MGLHTVSFDKLDHHLPIRRLDLCDERDVRSGRAGEVSVLELGRVRLGGLGGVTVVFDEFRRVREKTRMGLAVFQFGDLPILPDLIVVLIQVRNSETQRIKDLCDAIKPTLFVRGGLSDPHGVSESLNDKLVGENDAEHGQVGTATGEEEARAATFLKDTSELKSRQRRVQKQSKTTNILHNEILSNRICCLNARIAIPFT